MVITKYVCQPGQYLWYSGVCVCVSLILATEYKSATAKMMFSTKQGRKCSWILTAVAVVELLILSLFCFNVCNSIPIICVHLIMGKLSLMRKTFSRCSTLEKWCEDPPGSQVSKRQLRAEGEERDASGKRRHVSRWLWTSPWAPC